jgi:hypothetical protein
MKLELESLKLKKAFQLMQSLLGEQLVFLSAKSGKFCLEASNGSIYLKFTLPDTEIDGEGIAVINSKYVTALKLNENVRLEKISDNKLNFISGNMKGSIALSQDIKNIEYFRPTKEIPVTVKLPKSMLDNAIQKTSLANALVEASEGIKIKIDENLTVTSTDMFRSTLHKEALPFPGEPIEIMINPSLIGQIVSKITDPEIGIGIEKDTIRLSTLTIDCYAPSIQIETHDIEQFLSTLDQYENLCTTSLDVESFHKCITAVSSIITEKMESDPLLQCSLTEDFMSIKITSPHGEADSSFKLVGSTATDPYTTNLNAKYVLEMLHLLKGGNINIQFFTDFIVVTSESGITTYVMPVGA